MNISSLSLTRSAVSAIANIIELSCTTVYMIKKSMDYGDDVNSHTGDDADIVIPCVLPFTVGPIDVHVPTH